MYVRYFNLCKWGWS